MGTKLDHLYGNSAEVSKLGKKITNLSNITVKNNLSNQVIPQQKINAEPTDKQNIVRFQEISYTNVVNKTGNWTGELAVNSPAGKINTYTAYECIGQVIVPSDDICFSCGMVVGSNNNYPHSTTVYLTQGDNADNTIILRIRYQNNIFWIKRLGTYTGQINSFKLWVRKAYRPEGI